MTVFSTVKSIVAQPSLLWVVLVTVCCVFLYGVDSAPLLAYQRHDILEGQYWRLISANFLHTNHWHLLMNVAGLWVISLLFSTHFRRTGLFYLLLALAMCEGIGILVFCPWLIGYVGLSGVLHGLFVFGSILDVVNRVPAGYLLLIGGCTKVVYEQFSTNNTFVAELIGARVAVESHLVGVFAGIFCAVIWLAIKSRGLNR